MSFPFWKLLSSLENISFFFIEGLLFSWKGLTVWKCFTFRKINYTGKFSCLFLEMMSLRLERKIPAWLYNAMRSLINATSIIFQDTGHSTNIAVYCLKSHCLHKNRQFEKTFIEYITSVIILIMQL